MPKGPYLSTGRTPKQELWMQKVIENGGNGVKAAREVYDCTTYDSARATASQNFQRPRIRPDIEKAFTQRGITADVLAEKIKDALGASKDDEDRLLFPEKLYRLIMARPKNITH